jgi:hypothetical protein
MSHWNQRMLTAALAAALLTLNASAQPRPQGTEKSGPQVPGAKNPNRRGETLGERLSREKGVIRPHSGQDSEMIIRPPESPNKMPIIPPPGTQDKGPRAEPLFFGGTI